MTLYTVGQPYNPALPMPPQDTWQYNYRQDQHELVGFIARPTMAETADYRHGGAEFALVVQRDLIALAMRFGRQQWSDALYSWHLVPEPERTLPETDLPERRILLTVIVVDRADGRVSVLRAVTLSPEFTRALHTAIRDQSARPWPGQAEYDRQIAALYARYPDSADLARAASVRCVGGQ